MEELFELLNKKNEEKEESILLKLKENNKDYSSYEELNSDLNNLLNIFVSEEELDDYKVADEYSENKANYLFTVTALSEVDTYIVFLSISNCSLISLGITNLLNSSIFLVIFLAPLFLILLILLILYKIL